jgi:hypothetical protein
MWRDMFSRDVKFQIGAEKMRRITSIILLVSTEGKPNREEKN